MGKKGNADKDIPIKTLYWNREEVILRFKKTALNLVCSGSDEIRLYEHNTR